MKKFRLHLILLILAFAGACTDETFLSDNKKVAPPADLSYAETGEAREGKAIESGRPSVNTFGAEPTFTIGSGKIDGAALSEELLQQFNIVDTTGLVFVNNGNILTPATYLLDVKVETMGGMTTFTNGYSVKVLPALMEGLAYQPSTVQFERGKNNATTEPDFAGNSNDVSFAFGEFEGSEFFAIDASTGIISMSDKQEPEVGTFKLHVEGNNLADSVITFKNALTVNVVSKPYRLVYDPEVQTNVQELASRTSQEPVVTASNTGSVKYKLADGTSEFFAIDENTGAVTLQAMHTFTAGSTQYVDVIAGNDLGETLFEKALGFEIVPQDPVPPNNFTYADGNEGTVMASLAFSSAIPSAEGAYPISFAITSGNESGEFTIEPTTGQISLAKGNTLPVGDYPLVVEATNAYGSATVTYTVHVTTLIKTVIFDGGFNVGGAVKDGATGNMVSVDLDGNGTGPTAYKKAWYGKYNTFWTREGVKRSGAQMFGDKAENDDWLLAENIDLSAFESVELFLEYYMLYGGGNDDVNVITVKVSEDYAGDVTTATWVEVAKLNDLFDSKDNILGSGGDVTADYVDQDIIDLSTYSGKTVTIAIHSLHSLALNPAKTTNHLTRATFIPYFTVRGLEK
ncbi:DUF4958 family protein [Carboxylicivirga sediminis]|uniref:DUF4958 family protein n=1 Tax=Carboxylicivirga sediminis TaxID=2006564 RepID=A0A941F870_9BACT|nr:surface glycan-binding family protein [Carboxylicivirga sediminis]MBR8538142.1 DUF4958 family protein [Carboxylicivirga sediminis]